MLCDITITTVENGQECHRISSKHENGQEWHHISSKHLVLLQLQAL